MPLARQCYAARSLADYDVFSVCRQVMEVGVAVLFEELLLNAVHVEELS
jgi:hypothetical protein